MRDAGTIKWQWQLEGTKVLSTAFAIKNETRTGMLSTVLVTFGLYHGV